MFYVSYRILKLLIIILIILLCIIEIWSLLEVTPFGICLFLYASDFCFKFAFFNCSIQKVIWRPWLVRRRKIRLKSKLWNRSQPAKVMETRKGQLMMVFLFYFFSIRQQSQCVIISKPWNIYGSVKLFGILM